MSVARRDDAIPLKLENRLHECPERRLVLHEQDCLACAGPGVRAFFVLRPGVPLELRESTLSQAGLTQVIRPPSAELTRSTSSIVSSNSRNRDSASCVACPKARRGRSSSASRIARDTAGASRARLSLRTQSVAPLRRLPTARSFPMAPETDRDGTSASARLVALNAAFPSQSAIDQPEVTRSNLSSSSALSNSARLAALRKARRPQDVKVDCSIVFMTHPRASGNDSKFREVIPGSRATGEERFHDAVCSVSRSSMPLCRLRARKCGCTRRRRTSESNPPGSEVRMLNRHVDSPVSLACGLRCPCLRASRHVRYTAAHPAAASLNFPPQLGRAHWRGAARQRPHSAAREQGMASPQSSRRRGPQARRSCPRREARSSR